MAFKDFANFNSIYQRLTASLCAIVLALQFGCVTVSAPPKTPYQAMLGKVAIVAATQEPEIKFEGFARSKSEGSASRAGEFAGGCMIEAGKDPLLFIPPFNIILLGACGIVGGGVGAVVGAVEAPYARELHTAEAGMAKAIAVKSMQESLRNQVASVAMAKGANLITVFPESIQTATQLRDYRYLASSGVDTVIEVGLTKVSAEGEGIDAPLLFMMNAHVRLIRTTDNSQIIEADYAYLGEQMERSDWMANKAKALLRNLQAGYETLGLHIYENIFLLYPFPDREPRLPDWSGWYVFGLEPIYPQQRGGTSPSARKFGKYLRWSEIDTVRPTFRWQAFPRITDITAAPKEMSRVKNVRYDLVIAREHNLGASEVVYRREGLSDTTHTLQISLKPDTNYFWTVRARFELDGRERVTEWSSIPSTENEGWTSPSRKSYRFKTP